MPDDVLAEFAATRAALRARLAAAHAFDPARLRARTASGSLVIVGRSMAVSCGGVSSTCTPSWLWPVVVGRPGAGEQFGPRSVTSTLSSDCAARMPGGEVIDPTAIDAA